MFTFVSCEELLTAVINVLYVGPGPLSEKLPENKVTFLGHVKVLKNKISGYEGGDI